MLLPQYSRLLLPLVLTALSSTFPPLASSHVLPQTFGMQPGQQPLSGAKYRIRNATIDDVTIVSDIWLQAFADTPVEKYIFQYQDQYPEESRRCTIASRRKFFTKPEGDIRQGLILDLYVDEHSHIPVSAAVWKHSTAFRPHLSHPNEIHGDGEECAIRKDINRTRYDYVWSTLAPLRQRIDEAFGPDQLLLNGLGTIPAYQHRGFGESLVETGIKWGLGMNVNITLLSTPAAFPVYLNLGFQLVENFTFPSLEGDQDFWYASMVYSRH